MNKEIKNVKLYVKDIPKAKETEKIVREKLLKNGFSINNDDYQLVISIGGDGTFLKMLRSYHYNTNLYYTSINAGSLGFLTSVSYDQVEEFINNLKNKIFMVNELNILKTKYIENDEVHELTSINELTIRKKDFSCLRCDILVDDILLDKYIGDGLVISTSVGSTAYNLALGGAIIDHKLNTLLITPIVPITNKVYKSLNNSLVLNKDRKITIVLNDTNNLCLVSDGKIYDLNNVKKIEFVLSLDTIKSLVLNDYNYITNIKNKIIDSGE